jgi:chloride channel protein, CIC family
LRRSILTEKVARRGYHVSSEYSVDPLELLYAREVMRVPDVILPVSSTSDEALTLMNLDTTENQRLLPVLDELGLLAGVVTRGELEKRIEELQVSGKALNLREVMRLEPVVAMTEDPLRVVVNRMAQKGVTRMPVVERSGRFMGLISLDDLLKARSRHLEEEQRREQTLWFAVLRPHARSCGQIGFVNLSGILMLPFRLTVSLHDVIQIDNSKNPRDVGAA